MTEKSTIDTGRAFGANHQFPNHLLNLDPHILQLCLKLDLHSRKPPLLLGKTLLAPGPAEIFANLVVFRVSRCSNKLMPLTEIWFSTILLYSPTPVLQVKNRHRSNRSFL